MKDDRTVYSIKKTDGEEDRQKSKEQAIRSAKAKEDLHEDFETFPGVSAVLRKRLHATELGGFTVGKYVVLEPADYPQGVEWARERKERLEKTVEDTEQGLGTEFYVENSEGEEVPLDEYSLKEDVGDSDE